MGKLFFIPTREGMKAKGPVGVVNVDNGTRAFGSMVSGALPLCEHGWGSEPAANLSIHPVPYFCALTLKMFYDFKIQGVVGCSVVSNTSGFPPK